ncbi:hypothetical protein Uis1B_1290 [Bifidobacterium margollesii]|uniref:Uncharacterized protein n=1 Tax=Bifidobacterium margollesii TaxID=2020964 RepID=A0A2N5J9W8_9BIFI|nr:hypothetical protein [Bifidobacterium margollesii]PLS31000.1 hypothetical protein Uis1B_1290 [Bifidobacterium margollesii]
MVTTMESAENSGGTMLDTFDVADLFRRCDPDGYADARRRFYRAVNMNPFKKHPEAMLRMIEWSFCDWLAFDCAVDPSSTDADDVDGAPRFRMRRGKEPGESPYLATAKRLYDCDRINAAQLDDMREMDSTNFVSVFWITDAEAVRSRMKVEDLMHGGEYELLSAPDAAKYDGAHGGVIVNRIARVRGAWRPCAIAIYEARRPDTKRTRNALAGIFGPKGYHPDFPGLLRLFYGRARDIGLDWEDLSMLLGAGAR